jgi:putative tryptophan/tyrosine transport system substrate-binding protein
VTLKPFLFKSTYWRLLAQSCLLLWACIVSTYAHAWSNVTILTTNDSSAVTEFVKQLKLEINEQSGIKVNVSKNDSGLSINIPKDTLVIAVGTQALTYAGNLDESTPVIGVLVPKSSYESILKDSGRSAEHFSALYLDQPFNRQLSLIRAIFPNIYSIGVLLGPISQFQSNDLQSAAKKWNIEVNIRLVNKSDELQFNLEKLMSGKQLLLAIPDPLIYTRETAQTILLTTYRHQVPVIGFSQSYAKSGAIAAVFSSPKQYASEIANTIKQLPKDQVTLPTARAANKFSIEINRQVARSLDIQIADDALIYQQILKDER